MKKTFKKAVAMLLIMTTFAGCMAFSVSAEPTYGRKDTTLGNYSVNGVQLLCAFSYYYDTTNQDILTKVIANSDFIGNYNNSLTPDGAAVYTYNNVYVKYATGDGVLHRGYRSDQFYLDETNHVTESKMISDPLELDSTKRTQYAYSTQGMSTYLDSVHAENEDKVSSEYPKAGERSVLSTTQSWK